MDVQLMHDIYRETLGLIPICPLFLIPVTIRYCAWRPFSLPLLPCLAPWPIVIHIAPRN